MASELYDAYVKKLENSNTAANDAIDVSTKSQLDAIEQNKAALEKQRQSSYRGAFSDYKKETNPYGYNAEVRAAKGLDNSGKTETAMANYYGTYQNRLGKIDSDTQAGILQYDQNAAKIRAQAETQKLNNLADMNDAAAQALWTDDANTTQKDQWQKTYDLQVDQNDFYKKTTDRQLDLEEDQWDVNKGILLNQEERNAADWNYAYNQRVNTPNSNNGTVNNYGDYSEMDIAAANVLASLDNDANDPYVTYNGSANPYGSWVNFYEEQINKFAGTPYYETLLGALADKKESLRKKYNLVTS